MFSCAPFRFFFLLLSLCPPKILEFDTLDTRLETNEMADDRVPIRLGGAAGVLTVGAALVMLLLLLVLSILLLPLLLLELVLSLIMLEFIWGGM